MLCGTADSCHALTGAVAERCGFLTKCCEAEGAEVTCLSPGLGAVGVLAVVAGPAAFAILSVEAEASLADVAVVANGICIGASCEQSKGSTKSAAKAAGACAKLTEAWFDS